MELFKKSGKKIAEEAAVEAAAVALEKEADKRSFEVRVGIDTNFGLSKWREGSYPIIDLRDKIEEEANVTLRIVSNSFLVLKVEAENGKACKSLIEDYIKKTADDEAGFFNVLMYEETEEAPKDIMDSTYCNLFGFYEFQKLCTDMCRMIPLAKSAEVIETLRVTNYLVSVDRGCGFYSMLDYYGVFCNEAGLFEETKPCLWSTVVGDDNDKNAQTTSEILEHLSEAEEERVIGIDISYYLDKGKQDKLREFLNKLLHLSNKFVFFFRVPVLSDRALKDIAEVISDVLELQIIKVEPLNDFVLEDYALRRLAQTKYSFSDEGNALFLDMVHKEKADSRFYGFDSANKILNEMLWDKLKHDSAALMFDEDYDSESITKDDLSSERHYHTEEKKGFDELNELVGMETIATRIEEIVAQLKIATKNEGMARPCIHMRFVGAPGTGKTTVARIVGKIFKENGILSKGGFFEYTARNLCGEYVGMTAPKTQAICRDAYGSVLFIDEAYALYTGDGDGKDYGREALTTLIAEMENHRDDMVVIMAGYTDDMDKLMEGNAGLRSRMPYLIEFKSYSREELHKIFMGMVKKNFKYTEDLEIKSKEFFDKLSDRYLTSKEFANARFVRNLYERTWAKAALRSSEINEDQITICGADFELAAEEKEFSEGLMFEKKIGF